MWTNLRDLRQSEAAKWVRRTFGEDTFNTQEQATRFLEEALEVAQAAGVSLPLVARLVERVYSKPPGDLPQELGQAGLCLLVVSDLIGCSADAAEGAELVRVLSMPEDHFRKRYAAKIAAGITTND